VNVDKAIAVRFTKMSDLPFGSHGIDQDDVFALVLGYIASDTISHPASIGLHVELFASFDECIPLIWAARVDEQLTSGYSVGAKSLQQLIGQC
jgi:hypothetical protein